MTLRDVQLKAKKAGNPWLKSKGFRHSALISDFVPREAVKEWEALEISLLLNGREVQRSSVSRMIFPPSRLVHYLSYLYGLRKGDLIFTGTPAGVGSVETGDTLEASLDCHQENGSLSAGIARLKALIM
jgi:2-keto-4-pentenoate hydratase/2-oxohepta-3-ene-1,7-dioic acid hydratase in catechol pathway